MESEKFDLVFSGQILPRQDVATVKANMAALFKVSSAQVDALFSGKAVVLKRNVDLAAANRYRVAIKKAGARVDLVKAGTAAASPAKAEKVPQAAQVSASPVEAVVAPSVAVNTAVVNASAAKVELGLEAVGANLSDAIRTPVASVAAPNFEVFEAGSDLLSGHERTEFVAKEVDTSAFSVRDGGGNLLDDGEWIASLPLIVADLDVDVLPPGSNLINEREREPVNRVHIADLDLEIAPPGARLEAEKGPAAKAPNIDHIQLSD